MSISTHTHLMMFRYVIKSTNHKIDVIQFKDILTKKWGEVTVSSVVHLGCGRRAGLDPFEMLNEIMALVSELRMVLIVLDNAQKQMGDDYRPPLMPFKNEFLPKDPGFDDLLLTTKELYQALFERDQCANCGGQGWTYIDLDGEAEKETCQCSTDAEEVLIRQRGIYEKIALESR